MYTAFQFASEQHHLGSYSYTTPIGLQVPCNNPNTMPTLQANWVELSNEVWSVIFSYLNRDAKLAQLSDDPKTQGIGEAYFDLPR